MTRSPTRRPWRSLGWIVVTPLLMGESFCPATCSRAVSRGIHRAGDEIDVPAWNVTRVFKGEFTLSPARPRAVYEVKLVVGKPAGATYDDPTVAFDIGTEVPAVLRKACSEQTCDGYTACRTERGKSGWPPEQLIYPMVDAAGHSKYLGVSFLAEGGREPQFGLGCSKAYRCKYQRGGLPEPCRGPKFSARLSPASEAMKRDPATGLYTATFRVTLSALDPAGAGFDQLIFDGTPDPYEKGRGYPSRIEMQAAIVGPQVKKKTPDAERPPRPRLDLTVTTIE